MNIVLSAFPALPPWQVKTKEFAKQFGHVYTMTGRRRDLKNAMLSGHDSNTLRLVEQALRQACNTPIQGTASDICLVALGVLSRKFKKAKFDAHAVEITHDEIGVEVEEGHAQDVAKMMHDVMVAVPRKLLGDLLFDVPIVTDVETGYTWTTLEEINVED